MKHYHSYLYSSMVITDENLIMGKHCVILRLVFKSFFKALICTWNVVSTNTDISIILRDISDCLRRYALKSFIEIESFTCASEQTRIKDYARINKTVPWYCSSVSLMLLTLLLLCHFILHGTDGYLRERGGGSSLEKVPEDVPCLKVYFFGPLVQPTVYFLQFLSSQGYQI